MSVESSPSPPVILAENGGASSGRHSNASQRQAPSTPKSQTELQYTPRLKQRHHVLCFLLVAIIRSDFFFARHIPHRSITETSVLHAYDCLVRVTEVVDECGLRNIHNGPRRPRSVFNLGHRYFRLLIKCYMC